MSSYLWQNEDFAKNSYCVRKSLIACLFWNEKIPAKYFNKIVLLMSKNRPVRQGLAQGPQKLINQFPFFKYSWTDIHGKMRISRTIYSVSEKA